MAEEQTSQAAGAGEDVGRANVGIGLAVAALAVWIALLAADADGPIWLVMGALAAAAAVVGYTARGAGPLEGRSRIATSMGVLLFVVFVVGTVAEFA